MKRKSGRNARKGMAAALAVTLAIGGHPLGWMTGAVPVFATEAEDAGDDLLIEDTGEEVAVHEGADLEALRAAQEQETEAQTDGIELEDPQLQLEPASAEKLQEYLDNLNQMESPIGSDGELIIGRYIKNVMKELGYTVSEQSFHEGFLNEAGVDAPGVNIIAERGADAEERHRDILIICTHYDSRTSPEEGDPLSNDKSGAAVLLEMARILSYEETDTDICFLFLSGEEDGLYGSANFVKSLDEEHKNRVAGVLYAETVGYGPEYVYQLKTLDGQENDLGNLVREEGLFSETMILPMPGGAGTQDGQPASGSREEGSGQTGKTDEESENAAAQGRQDWNYTPDSQTGQKLFAEAGLTAVTVCQNVEEAWAGTADSLISETDETEPGEQEAGTAEIDMEDLQKITDILASAVGQIMSETTASFLH